MIKNNLSQRGFIAPVLLVVIALLLVGGGFYFYKNKKVVDSVIINEVEEVNVQNKDIESFKLGTLEFSYPNKLILNKTLDGVVLSHLLYKEHVNSCDLKDGLTINEAVDFNVTFKIFDQSMKDVVLDVANESSYISKNFIKNGEFVISEGFIDKYKIGLFDGYRITSGVEGCGNYTYYFPISATKTLFIVRSFYLQTFQVNRNQLEKMPGFISSTQEEQIFKDILSSAVGLEQQKTLSIKVFFPNKIYNPEMLDCRIVYPVTRIIPQTQGVASAAISELTKGPTSQEEKDGYFGAIPDGTKLNSIKITDGVALVDFNERIGDGFTSCSGSMRLNAISKTLLQFPTVKEVRYSVNGNANPDELQP